MKKFTNETMYEIINFMQNELLHKDSVQIKVLNPSVSKDLFSGEIIKLEEEFIYRSFKVWSDLSEILFCKMYVSSIDKYFMDLQFEKLNSNDSFHNQQLINPNDKYGIESIFFRINKNEDPTFLNNYVNALKNVKIENKKVVLNLGINKADEFEVIKQILDNNLSDIEFHGVDFSSTAIEFSKERFPFNNFNFYNHDINKLDELDLPKADLLISIGTLQSSSLNFKLLFMNLIQNYLEDKGSVILGFPNCRWIGNEVVFGAKAKNYTFSEQSVLYNDVMFCKKYLQQKKYRVTLTGKNYLFLTATSIK